MKILFYVLLLLCLFVNGEADASRELKVVYPYSLNQQASTTVGRGVMPLYLDILSYDEAAENVSVKVQLPAGFKAVPTENWQVVPDGSSAVLNCALEKDYSRFFKLLYIKADGKLEAGQKFVLIQAEAPGWQKEERIGFNYEPGVEERSEGEALAKPTKEKFNWYIQNVTVPVDILGNRDDRTEANVVYIKDTAMEALRNRLTGEGSTSWSSVFNHPAAFLLLELRNPQRDVSVLKFEAQLLNKETGEVVEGLCTAGTVADEVDDGWANTSQKEGASRALISLDGGKSQNFIIPLYVDYLSVLEGDYVLQVKLSGNGQEKFTRLPLKLKQKNNVGLTVFGIALLCLLLCLCSYKRFNSCIRLIGAKGAITVALFAAIAFGGISLPTTFMGELLHVFLGPFSGFVTGLLSGVLQYMLVFALLLLYRRPGVLALMLMVKYTISALIFGSVTPLGILNCCVNIVILESTLRLMGFFNKEGLSPMYMLMVVMSIGVADGLITFISMEQMMFFYRLYYADWYLASYIIINGFLYSSIGAWLGYKIGTKLQLVTGE